MRQTLRGRDIFVKVRKAVNWQVLQLMHLHI